MTAASSSVSAVLDCRLEPSSTAVLRWPCGRRCAAHIMSYLRTLREPTMENQHEDRDPQLDASVVSNQP